MSNFCDRTNNFGENNNYFDAYIDDLIYHHDDLYDHINVFDDLNDKFNDDDYNDYSLPFPASEASCVEEQLSTRGKRSKKTSLWTALF